MMGAKLTFPIARRYDTKFILDGIVTIQGFDFEFTEVGPAPWPTFKDMVTDLSYDISEQAMSHYLIAKDLGKPLTAIPVFPSRFFPQAGITVNRSANISKPADLAGKRVGVTGFGYNPAAWIRGILQHQYDAPVERVIWVEDADDRFFGGLPYPRSNRYTVEKATNLEGLFEAGELDVIVPPSGGPRLTERTAKLFPDPNGEIERYAKATGVFPINTIMTINEEVVRAHPDLPRRMMEAFEEAKGLYRAAIGAGKETDHMGLDVGVLTQMGLLPDQYGLEPNRKAIRMMIQYCYEQGLIRTLYEPEDLFCAI